MAQRMPTPFDIDPNDPRAPSQEEWDRMTPEERDRVVAMLPNEVPEELQPPEGDQHFEAKAKARFTLDDFFHRTGRKIYVSGELNVYYPNEPRFSPDVFAVLDVEPRKRKTWIVSCEGKGLDLTLEVHVSGSRDKDYRLNVERYARLGIAEYFLFDAAERRVFGYRLPPGGRVYRPILPQSGRLASAVLGLDLSAEGDRLRFYLGEEPLPEAQELVAKLERRVDDLTERHQAEAERAEALACALAERQDRDEGEKETRTIRLRAAVRRVLGRRGLELSPEEDARIAACSDPATLERWLEEAAVATSAAEALVSPTR